MNVQWSGGVGIVDLDAVKASTLVPVDDEGVVWFLDLRDDEW